MIQEWLEELASEQKEKRASAEVEEVFESLSIDELKQFLGLEKEASRIDSDFLQGLGQMTEPGLPKQGSALPVGQSHKIKVATQIGKLLAKVAQAPDIGEAPPVDRDEFIKGTTTAGAGLGMGMGLPVGSLGGLIGGIELADKYEPVPVKEIIAKGTPLSDLLKVKNFRRNLAIKALGPLVGATTVGLGGAAIGGLLAKRHAKGMSPEDMQAYANIGRANEMMDRGEITPEQYEQYYSENVPGSAVKTSSFKETIKKVASKKDLQTFGWEV